MVIFFLGSFSTVKATVYTLGTATTTSNSASITPFCKASSDARHQYLVLASELTSQGAGFANIASLAFNVTAAAGSPAFSNFNIKIKSTSATTLSNAAFDNTGFATNYSSNVTLTTTGWTTFTFSTPFSWNGSDNLLIEVCYNNSAGGGTNATVVATGNLTSRNRYNNTNSTSPTVIGCDLASVTSVVNTRPDMQLDLQPIVCNGAPGAGTINAAATYCTNGNPFSLSLVNYEYANGITRQWYKGTSATGPWTAIPGATGTTASTTMTADTWFICSSICTNTNDSSTTPVIFVDAQPHYTCMCKADVSPAPLIVSRVTINGVTHTNPTCDGVPHHDSLTATPYSAVINSTVNFEIEVKNCAVYTHGEVINLLADFNHNSEFDGVDGLWYANYTFSSGSMVATFSGTITIPATALPGLTTLRVSNGVTCATLNTTNAWYATQDYLIDVLPQVACSGTPAIGTTSAIDSICKNTTFTVTHTNTNPNSGVAYQWQSATLGGSFSNISGQTNPSGVTTSLTQSMAYRLRAICTATNDTVYTTPDTVIARSWIECYCIPPGRANSTSSLNRVVLNEIDHNIDVSNPAKYGFDLYDGAVANIYKGTTNPLKIQAFGSFQWVHSLIAYIDFNHDGVFGQTEQIVYSSFDDMNLLVDYPFTVPNTALDGLTRMRVRAFRTGQSESGCGQGTPGVEHANAADFYVDIHPAPSPLLKLHIYPEGPLQSNALAPVLFNAGFTLDSTVCDSVIIELHDAADPYTLLYSADGILKTNGEASAIFPVAAFGNSYYVAFRHRNHVTTWSKYPLRLYPAVKTYDMIH